MNLEAFCNQQGTKQDLEHLSLQIQSKAHLSILISSLQRCVSSISFWELTPQGCMATVKYQALPLPLGQCFIQRLCPDSKMHCGRTCVWLSEHACVLFQVASVPLSMLAGQHNETVNSSLIKLMCVGLWLKFLRLCVVSTTGVSYLCRNIFENVLSWTMMWITMKMWESCLSHHTCSRSSVLR